MSLLTLLVLSTLAFAGVVSLKWNSDNNPKYWDRSFEYRISQFPLQADAKKRPWSDTYWPSYKGGIANRWQARNAPGFNYKLYTLQELKNKPSLVDHLSPAEKYDILKRRYDYPLVKSEWRRVSPNDARWEGLCHGWATAAINYNEPNQVTMTNGDGLKIPFGSSDVKALLIYFLGEFAQGYEDTEFLGQRCNYDLKTQPNEATRRECADVNAGSFHVLFGNLVGKRYESFVVDITRDAEVWNQPVSGYKVTLAKPRPADMAQSASGSVQNQKATFTMYYIDETSPSVKPVTPKVSERKLTFDLDLDRNGKILGGYYPDTKAYRVDFMWKSNAPAFFGYFKQLQDIYREATVTNRLVEGEDLEDAALMPRHEISIKDLEPEELNEKSFKFSDDDEEDSDAPRVWQVKCKNQKPLKFKLNSLNIRRRNKWIRIYEVEEDQIQAPVAILQGQRQLEETVEVRQGADLLIVYSRVQQAAYGVPKDDDDDEEDQNLVAGGVGFELEFID